MEEYPTIPNMFDRMMSMVPDPIHAMMIKRHKQQNNGEISLPPEVKYADDDIKQLEDFCRQHGIFGFNCGSMHPRLALKMLKSKMGVVDIENYNKSNNSKNLLLG
jgi:hypothetical protein